ncbi:HEAT repeat domain-containing protein [Streptomyces sp. NPDC053493]|uniref:HEAT repeat domain-containing protein n=1 Tax=Streptomyces sp. NPDC053493 TaxID=3365705 RepID=UPI0037D72E76
MDQAGHSERLVAAVGAGDAEEIGRLLYEGAGPDTPGTDGLPVLCAAVAAHDARAADALMQGGADPDHPLPDGSTPLLRAIAGGSYAVFMEVRGKDPALRLRGPAGERALATAREADRRCRTAPPGPRTVVQDGTWGQVEELVLDGRTVRAGHPAILTELERALGVRTPFGELADRAAARHDPDHVDWWSALHVVIGRHDRSTRDAVAALTHHPDPYHRRFAAEVLRCQTLFEDEADTPYAEENSALLARWAAEEAHPGVLADVLFAWASEHEHPDLVATGLRYADHPDPAVRAAVPGCLAEAALTPVPRGALLGLSRDPSAEVRRTVAAVLGRAHDGSPDVRAALVALARDPDAEVRRSAAECLAESADHAPEIADALADLRDPEHQTARLVAAYGLMLREDPRTPEAVGRIGDDRTDIWWDHRWDRVWEWDRNRRQRESSASAEQ